MVSNRVPFTPTNMMLVRPSGSDGDALASGMYSCQGDAGAGRQIASELGWSGYQQRAAPGARVHRMHDIRVWDDVGDEEISGELAEFGGFGPALKRAVSDAVSEVGDDIGAGCDTDQTGSKDCQFRFHEMRVGFRFPCGWMGRVEVHRWNRGKAWSARSSRAATPDFRHVHTQVLDTRLCNSRRPGLALARYGGWSSDPRNRNAELLSDRSVAWQAKTTAK